MKKISILLILVMIVTKSLGFAREIVLSYFYGATGVSDAYLISLTIPGTIFAFIGVGLATSYIPIYQEVVRKRNIKQADIFTSNVINYVFLICSVIILLVFSFTTPIVKIFASGLDGENLKLAVLFTRISVTTLYFSGLTYIFKGYLEVNNNFLIPALMGIPTSIITMLSIYLSVAHGVIIISIGSAIAIFFQLVFLIPFILKKRFTYSFQFNMKDEYIKKMIYLSIPVVIGVSVSQINVLVDRTLASQIAVGGISMVTYANKVSLFIQDIFVISIATLVYPVLSKMASNDNIEGLKYSLLEALKTMLLLVLPATLGIMIFSESIINLLFGRGAFDYQKTLITADVLFYYSIGIIGFGLREILSRGFYSLQDTKTPMINAAIAMIVNIFLNVVLSKYMGLSGLALATSISSFVASLLLYISLKRKIGNFKVEGIVTFTSKIIGATILMSLCSYFFYQRTFDHLGSTISLFLSIIIATLSYFSALYFLKVEELVLLVKNTTKKIRS